jgi:type I restriction enzyme, S subunit
MNPILASQFKQTDAGLIPTDWDVKTVGEALQFYSGKAHEPYISRFGKFIVVNSKFISTDGAVRKYCTKNLMPARAGDVLMVMSDLPNGRALAKCFLVDRDDIYAVNQRVCIFRSRAYDSRYLRYILSRNPYFMAFDDGVQQTHLLNDPIKRCPIVLPSALEQRAIADALSDTDELIASIERLITKKRAIKQGMMQELLTGRYRLPGFDEPWNSRRLFEMLSYEQPGRFLVRTSKQLESGRIPVLTAGKTFVLGYTNEIFGIYKAHPVIIFDDFTTASKFVDFNFKAKSSAMKILSARPGTDLRFIYERMQLIDFPLGDHKRYWISEYSQQQISVPDEAEQVAIAAVLQDCTNEIRSLEARLAKTIAVKQGMIQELLTGRIRLPVKEAVS